jgi:hypothetical protein
MKLADFTEAQRAFIGGLCFEATTQEREACAKIAAEYARRDNPNAVTICDLVATAIRDRK